MRNTLTPGPPIPGLHIGAIPSDTDLHQKLDALLHRQNILHSQFIDVKRSVSPETIRRLIEERDGEDLLRLEKLRNDCVKVLGLLREKGIVTQEEIAEALNG